MSVRMSDLIEQWLAATMLADPTLATLVGARVYPDEAPVDEGYPVVTFQKWPHPRWDGHNIIAAGNAVVGADFCYWISAGDQSTSKDRAIAVANAVRDCFRTHHMATVGNPPINVINIQELTEHSAPYRDGGLRYQREGSDFRITVDAGG